MLDIAFADSLDTLSMDDCVGVLHSSSIALLRHVRVKCGGAHKVRSPAIFQWCRGVAPVPLAGGGRLDGQLDRDACLQQRAPRLARCGLAQQSSQARPVIGQEQACAHKGPARGPLLR